jgi:hypothetical protein
MAGWFCEVRPFGSVKVQNAMAKDVSIEWLDIIVLSAHYENGKSDLNWNKKLGTYNTADSTFWDGSLFKGLGFALNLHFFCRASSPEFPCHDRFRIQFGSHFILRFCEHWKREQPVPLFKNLCQPREISPGPIQARSHHMIPSIL